MEPKRRGAFNSHPSDLPRFLDLRTLINVRPDSVCWPTPKDAQTTCVQKETVGFSTSFPELSGPEIRPSHSRPTPPNSLVFGFFFLVQNSWNGVEQLPQCVGATKWPVGRQPQPKPRSLNSMSDSVLCAQFVGFLDEAVDRTKRTLREGRTQWRESLLSLKT